MIVYGRNVAKDLLKSSTKIQSIILQDGFNDKDLLSMIENAKIKVQYKPKHELDRLSDGVHQGIILTIPDYPYRDLNSVLNSDSDDVVVVLDHLEDSNKKSRI